ncbi:FAD-binding domain-containing protein [Flammeovirga kamogawensis]|uniref:Deoxyribodipyrimidine photolyase n=1 Tax=Flammeovirga kamogawensis TaxID=373891 RepID=A0ABX8GTJ2_9BACT|nr:FAD-binding domain-containing protein [Flammeovirga kamogawensis]MBB6460044.1 deoxyribodipyrimidine photo-lyase [Flammeovirga kamogawensis]QWG06910.1 deoxyribodipyrimidine photolyase [Flammeovirga kamogawensis]TRX68731.1 deoxyribodipyrimidine photolyase [Flammeovirga kamogawensis]
MHHFSTKYTDILEKIDQFSPLKYGGSRNYIDGGVSYLSPYISRGVISTRQVLDHLMRKGYDFYKSEKFIQELAWRDYWQQIWIDQKEHIDFDLKHPQPNVDHYKLPKALANSQTGIEAIDNGINALKESGYMHNHMRMYVAMLSCNIGKSHWLLPAKWMYYHLLDADWASNALSWQWVAGANSNKKYVANQANINKYCHSTQEGTFLDITYQDFEKIKTPKHLLNCVPFTLSTELPKTNSLIIDESVPTFIYNSYQLDPTWNSTLQGNRILLLEPSHFNKYPISEKSLDFIIDLSKNIDNIQLFVGEFTDLQKQLGASSIYYKEHPTTSHYIGNREERDWISNVKGNYSSFFKFWKKVKKEIYVVQ